MGSGFPAPVGVFTYVPVVSRWKRMTLGCGKDYMLTVKIPGRRWLEISHLALDLKLNDRYQRTILCKDPFKPTDPRVDEMISSG